MYYHIFSFIGTTNVGASFTQNATSQDATPGPTGLGPASFLLGLPDSLSGVTGNASDLFSANWFGGYVQDQWRATRKLTISAGLRYDYVSPLHANKVLTGLDFNTGQFMLTEPVPPLFPKATIPSGYSYPQTNGFEPRFGLAYRVSDRTVLRSAFAIIDDHNRIVQAEGGSLNLCWPTAGPLDVTLQNRGLPNLFIDALPAASSLIDPLVPLVSQSFDPNAKIPYSIEYNFGIERQLPSSMVLKVDYVGSVSRHQMIQDNVNTASIPGPGPLAARGGNGVFRRGEQWVGERLME